MPIIFGVLTTESIEQALERAGNKGFEYAASAIEMATLLRAIQAAPNAENEEKRAQGG